MGVSVVSSSGSPGPGCEHVDGGFLVEPVSAVTSLAFVVAAGVVLASHRRRELTPYALLVAGIGAGSVIQHGPDPAWSDPAHDLPLLATVCFVGADAVAALTGRRRVWWWWALPSAALLVVVLAAPRAGDLAQVGAAGVAVLATLLRARARPGERRRIAVALGLLTVGGLVGRLSRTGGPLCDPGSLLQGHAVWHLLAAAALVVLGPLVTSAREAPTAARTDLPGGVEPSLR